MSVTVFLTPYLFFSTLLVGAAAFLTELSETKDNLVVTEWCCYGFYCLSRHCLCPGEMLSREILPCLLRLCETANERIRYLCAGVLAQISQISYLDTSSAIITAVNMMKSETNTSKCVQ
jgi:hypothetical protein